MTFILLAASCSTEQGSLDEDKFSTLESAVLTQSCLRASSPLKGIDVSHHQGTINWTSVKNDGVKYAFIRASDGLDYPDTEFATNWANSRAAGVRHGVYQYFRPSKDVIAQAELMLGRINYTVEADDLPPVIDIETTGGLTPQQVADKSKIWIDYVKEKTGVTPIIYTGAYFWDGMVGAPEWGSESPLWHAAYPQNQSTMCTNISEPWTHFTFWQHTDSGTVAGINTPVDMNKFDGTEADLVALTPAGGYGSGVAQSCGVIERAGGMIDDGDRCFVKGGPSATMREVASAGEGGDLVWTYATASANEGNYGEWRLDFAEAGRYSVEVYTSAAFAKSTQARYEIHASGTDHDVNIDQTAVDGWQTLGEFDFAAGADQEIHLSDNTGESLAAQVQLAFDAVRITRIDDTIDPEEPEPVDAGCCRATGPSNMTPGLLLAFGLAFRRRRRTAA